MNFFNHYAYGPAIALVVTVFVSGAFWELQALAALFVSYVLFLATYEVGLLVNDLVAARSETHPTVRIELQPIARILLAVAVRFLFGSFVYILTVVVLPAYAAYFTNVYVPVLFTLLVVYGIHNSIHLVHMYGRLVTFTILRLFRWFAPIFFLFVDLGITYQIFLAVLFVGMHTYYLYDYAATKHLIPRFLEHVLPHDLEVRLLVFSAASIFYLLVIYGREAVWFSAFVVLYLLALLALRLTVRTRRA